MQIKLPSILAKLWVGILILLTACSPTTSTLAPTNTPLQVATVFPQPTDAISTIAPTLTATLPALSATTIQGGAQDQAHFISETYPDGSNVAPGATFQKSWELQNSGTTTWTTDYRLVFVSSSFPNEHLGSPDVVSLSKAVDPGETIDISVPLTAPQTPGQYKVTWRLLNPQGQSVSVDGYDLWVLINVGNAQANSQTGSGQQSVTAGGVTVTLVNVTYAPNEVDVAACFDLPSLEEWMPYDSRINIKGQTTEASSVSYYPPVSKQDISTYLQTTHRCFMIGFPASSNLSDEMTISIGDIYVDAVQFLEQNCARAQQELAPKYPDLKFTCVPPSSGDYYKLVQLPQDMSSQQARQIIIDVMNQTIYGPWTFTITR